VTFKCAGITANYIFCIITKSTRATANFQTEKKFHYMFVVSNTLGD